VILLTTLDNKNYEIDYRFVINANWPNKLCTSVSQPLTAWQG